MTDWLTDWLTEWIILYIRNCIYLFWVEWCWWNCTSLNTFMDSTRVIWWSCLLCVFYPSFYYLLLWLSDFSLIWSRLVWRVERKPVRGLAIGVHSVSLYLQARMCLLKWGAHSWHFILFILLKLIWEIEIAPCLYLILPTTPSCPRDDFPRHGSII